jgi:hypothetical protein
LEKFGWETLGHPSYSLDLAPSNFHLFSKMKQFLSSKWMAVDEEVEETVMDCLNGLMANSCDEGIVKLVPHLGKCLSCNGDYMEK